MMGFLAGCFAAGFGQRKRVLFTGRAVRVEMHSAGRPADGATSPKKPRLLIAASATTDRKGRWLSMALII